LPEKDDEEKSEIDSTQKKLFKDDEAEEVNEVNEEAEAKEVSGTKEKKFLGRRDSSKTAKLKGEGHIDLYGQSHIFSFIIIIFIETPFKAIEPLLTKVFNQFSEETRGEIVIYEPACGNGAISTVFMGRGFKVIASDKNFGDVKVDYLTAPPIEYSFLVTNPPFTLGFEFLKKAYEAGKPFCMLLPIEYLSRKKTNKLLFRYGVTVGIIPPVKFMHDGEQVQVGATAWFCWDSTMSTDVRCIKWFNDAEDIIETEVIKKGEVAVDDDYDSEADSDYSPEI
jgi:hypothetical protein